MTNSKITTPPIETKNPSMLKVSGLPNSSKSKSHIPSAEPTIAAITLAQGKITESNFSS
jgi:hypothetical protein